MEEMQKAFNKTIIKLQNTSRIAQEQVGSRKQTHDMTWKVGMSAGARQLTTTALCVPGPEADRFHPGAAEPAGERHQADAQPHSHSGTAAERGQRRSSWLSTAVYNLFSMLVKKKKYN